MKEDELKALNNPKHAERMLRAMEHGQVKVLAQQIYIRRILEIDSQPSQSTDTFMVELAAKAIHQAKIFLVAWKGYENLEDERFENEKKS